jgi:arsenate reductase
VFVAFHFYHRSQKSLHMRTHQREILIYYRPESSTHRQTVAHAQSLVPHVRTFSFDQAPSAGYSWQQILEALDLPPKSLLNKAHPYYQEHIRGRDFDNECWAKIFQRNPDLLKAPIAIRGRQAILCQSSTDIYRLAKVAEKVTE